MELAPPVSQDASLSELLKPPQCLSVDLRIRICLKVEELIRLLYHLREGILQQFTPLLYIQKCDICQLSSKLRKFSGCDFVPMTILPSEITFMVLTLCLAAPD